MAETRINLDYQVNNTQFDNKVNTVISSGTSANSVVNISGDTMTGELKLPALSITDVHSSDSFKIYGSRNGTISTGYISFGKDSDDKFIIGYDNGSSFSSIILLNGAKEISISSSNLNIDNTSTIDINSQLTTLTSANLNVSAANATLNATNFSEDVSNKTENYSSDFYIKKNGSNILHLDSSSNANLTINDLTINASNSINLKVNNEELIKLTADGKVSISHLLPIGTVLMFNGNGIHDAASRSSDIGSDPSDTISMPGWYVCNGKSGTPNLLNKFIRSEAISGNTGGSDDAVVVSHNHGGSVGGSGKLYTNYTDPDLTHSHNVYQGVGGNGVRSYSTGYSANNIHTQSHDHSMSHKHSINSHSHTISSDGVNGTGKNMPAYYSLIFIIRMN